MLSMADELETLREQNRQLRSLLADPVTTANVYRKLGVTGTKAELLALLMKHERVSREMAMEAIYGHQADQPGETIVNVMLTHLRKILGLHAVVVQNIWGIGWFISPEHKKLIRELCA